jgi:hypothetical protein
MAAFSPADAALEGFRIGRENPGGLAIWTLAFFAASLLAGALLIRSGGAQAMADLMAITAERQPDPARFMAALQRAGPALLAAQWPMMLAQVFVQAAVLRVGLRAEDRRAYLRLGGDELRLLAALVFILVASMLATIVVGFLGGLISAASPALGVPVVIIGSVAVALFISTRLLLLYPLAIADRSLNVGEAWRLTQGRFWPILGARVLAFVFFLIVSLLGSVISVAIRSVAGEPRAGPASSMTALMAPTELAALGVESLLQALGAVLLSAPAIAIYRALRRGPAEAF